MTTTRLKHLVIDTPQGVAGDLWRESQFVFNYHTTDRTREVALGMPLRAQSYGRNVLPPIFTMSLPEGYLAQRLVERLGRFTRIDDLVLMAATGQHGIGRLRFSSPEFGSHRAPANIGLRQILSDTAGTALFEHLLDRYVDSGISGMQPKVLVPDADRAIPERATLWQTDLIVKSGGDEYPFLAVNEFLCMEVARRAGFRVPRFWLSDDGSLFVVERFDLVDDEPLGFEDMAVLLDLGREPTGHYKYSQSYEAIARVVAAYCGSNTTESLRRLFESVALSVMVRNGDAHLKNFGLLYDHPQGRDPYLAPIYDVVTTSVYETVDPRTGFVLSDRMLALKLARSRHYPNRAILLEYGRTMCRVSDPDVVIERIAQAMTETWAVSHSRLPTAFAKRYMKEWDGGRLSLLPAAVTRP